MSLVYDVTVIGGGHAGIEAVGISSQFSQLKIALISMPNVPLGSAPCNPAVGGVGKGQVVRELDALGGTMGFLADVSAIQYRTLNASKGPAVQSTRVQIDKNIYSREATKFIESLKNVTLVLDKVLQLNKKNGLFELTLSSGLTVKSQKVILTTGTFLKGRTHSGSQISNGGRLNCESSQALNDLICSNDSPLKINLSTSRFKTGTPPRLDFNSVDFTVMEPQDSDETVKNFHWNHKPFERFQKQISCFLTRTNRSTHEIIGNSKEDSPLFNGQIKGVGPRYCPSIEDKVYRYPDRFEHHIFIEPEELEFKSIYPNGLSTSLPLEIQEKFLQTIKGLENCQIIHPGYAVEYDVIDTTQLNRSLELNTLEGLYFAGQINGTSGYEEAAGQGYVAGVNAALAVTNKEPLEISRYDSYIGVMIEDLISSRRDEPYRLFTSRAENRLMLREDNVYTRMNKYRKQLQLNEKIDIFYRNYSRDYEILGNLCDTDDSLKAKLKNPEVQPQLYLESFCKDNCVDFNHFVIAAVAIQIKYEGYIERTNQQDEKIKKLDSMQIDWQELIKSQNISFECRERITKVAPKNFGQLRVIEGIRPATLSLVAGRVW